MGFKDSAINALPSSVTDIEFEAGDPRRAEVRSHPDSDLVRVAIIDERALSRDTLTQALALSDSRFRGRAFADSSECELSSEPIDTSVILLACGAISHVRPSFEEEFRGLVGAHPDIPVVVIGESEDPRYIVEILARGARGYIPSSVGLNVAIGALCLAMAGGTFVPLSALRDAGHERSERQQSVHRMLGLSERQAIVAEAVVLGKPNKIIAYELRLCESTVKVHIRSIMKKLHARNRTEVAFKLQAAKNGPLSS